MNFSVCEGIGFFRSSATASAIRIERHGDSILVCLASRDESGRMRIESCRVQMEQITSLPSQASVEYRELTDQERQSIRAAIRDDLPKPMSFPRYLIACFMIGIGWWKASDVC